MRVRVVFFFSENESPSFMWKNNEVHKNLKKIDQAEGFW